MEVGPPDVPRGLPQLRLLPLTAPRWIGNSTALPRLPSPWRSGPRPKASDVADAQSMILWRFSDWAVPARTPSRATSAGGRLEVRSSEMGLGWSQTVRPRRRRRRPFRQRSVKQKSLRGRGHGKASRGPRVRGKPARGRTGRRTHIRDGHSSSDRARGAGHECRPVSATFASHVQVPIVNI